MKRALSLAGAAAAAVLALTSFAAAAVTGYTTGTVNMRAGPSTSYPRITTIPEDSRITVYGCTTGYRWCDTSWRGRRGWVSGRYIEYVYASRRVLIPDYGVRIGVPIISFSIGNYWPRYYRDYYWYDDWYDDYVVVRRPRRTIEPPPAPPAPALPSTRRSSATGDRWMEGPDGRLVPRPGYPCAPDTICY